MKGFAAASLFKIGKDGLTFNSISKKDFREATKSLDKEGKALAKGYMRAINGKETNTVEVVRRNEQLSEKSKESIASYIPQSEANKIKTGAQFEDYGFGAGGALPSNYDGKLVKSGSGGTHALVVEDPKSLLNYNDGIKRTAMPGETLAHELIGHGLGGAATNTDGSVEAIQAGNLYLKSTGANYFRPNHGAYGADRMNEPQGIPSFLQSDNLNFFDSEN